MTPNLAPTAAKRGPRVSSTPFARRLARERGLALSALVGTGPNGRLTGRDVLGFAAAPANTPAHDQPVVAGAYHPSPAALAATVSLDSLRSLLPQFEIVSPAIEIVDVGLKAMAAARRGLPEFADAAIVLGARRGEGDRTLADLDRLTLGAIAAMRHKDDNPGPPSEGSHLAFSWIDRGGVRPVAMPMAAGAVARLVLVGDMESDHAECLLSYDPRRIDDRDAADFLLEFKSAMEIPLRLIA